LGAGVGISHEAGVAREVADDVEMLSVVFLLLFLNCREREQRLVRRGRRTGAREAMASSTHAGGRAARCARTVRKVCNLLVGPTLSKKSSMKMPFKGGTERPRAVSAQGVKLRLDFAF